MRWSKMKYKGMGRWMYLMRLTAFILFLTGSFLAGGTTAVRAESLLPKEQQETDYTEEFIDILDMGAVEEYLASHEETENLSFYELVSGIAGGEIPINGKSITDSVVSLLWKEIRANKDILILVLLLAVSCSFVKNFADVFRNTYISDICFVIIYLEMIALLMKSFLIMNEIVTGSMEKIVEFMSMLIPVFCMSLSIGMADITAAGFYEIAFLVIYIVQWVMLAFLLPMVQIFIVTEFMNYMIPGEKFTRMCELLESAVKWCLKFAVTVIVGLNVVQGIMAPAIDRLKMSGVTKTIGMIPGVGNAVNVLSEMMLGAGMVIKGSVGTAGIVILLVIFLVPFSKMLVLSLLYKVTAAVSEPIADKRISGSINSVYTGCVLLQKIMLTSLALFLLTIAMIMASSNFIM